MNHGAFLGPCVCFSCLSTRVVPGFQLVIYRIQNNMLFKNFLYIGVALLLSQNAFADNKGKQDPYYLSRANCMLPHDVFYKNQLRNESITWDPIEFWDRFTKIGGYKYYQIKTTSSHNVMLTGEVKMHLHDNSDEELWGIHSAVTHRDDVAQSLFGVAGDHFYKGPWGSDKEGSQEVANTEFTKFPNTWEEDCNLKLSQWIGGAQDNDPD
ncbi:hypothetical protein bplSymb_SCF02601P008 [Bathymodiolus platifrons methanotrophic gill symbiont]|nr:hypothetical protein bplSymb_SCF02601P008 [Bathymodiolus platifrons methanotrophic gill symbiont]